MSPAPMRVAPGKWITGLNAEQPLSVAARRGLEQRFGEVLFCLPLAAKKWSADDEFVHQLRVTSRRATAALDLFSPLLPPRRRRRLKRALRRLRRSAGEARDLDVLAARLKKLGQRHKEKKSQFRSIREKVKDKRIEAQEPLLEQYRKLRRRRFEDKARQLIDRVQWSGDGVEPCFAEAARTGLSPIVSTFFDSANAGLISIEALHQTRIHGKGVRYAMELLAGAFDASFREELYPIFEQTQDKLGAINDHAVAAALYQMWREQIHKKRQRRLLRELIEWEEEQSQRCISEFRNWWTADKAQALRERFDVCLAPLFSPNRQSA